MKCLPGLALGVGLLAPNAAVAQALPDPAATSLGVTVHVLDDTSKLPVAAAEIRVLRLGDPDPPGGLDADPPLRSIGSGAISFVAVRGASLRIEARALGYSTRSVDLRDLDRSRGVEIFLERAPLRMPDVRVVVARGEIAVTRHRLDRQTQTLSGDRLADWLRALPGFDVIGRGPGGPSTPTIRGSRAAAVDVTLDGVSLADPLTGTADLSLVPAATLQSVVATAGAGLSPGWGGGAGSIRLRSREATPGIALGMGAGSFGRVATDLEVGVVGPGVTISGFGRFQTARNDFQFNNRTLPSTPSERRINADYESWAGVVRVRARTRPLTLIGRLTLVDRGAPGHMSNHVWDAARWNERASTIGFAWGRAITGSDDPKLSVSWGGRTQEFTDPRVDRRGRLRADQVVASGNERLPANVRVSWKGTWERVAGETLAAPATRILGGARFSRAFTLSPGWSLEAALSLAGAEEATGASPSVGLSWSGAPGLRVWGRAGQGVRLPTFGDLFLRPGTGARPNPDLSPERIRLDAEVGAEVARMGGMLTVRTTAFYRHTDDPIIWLPSVVAVWQPTNAGWLTALGLETSVGWNSEGTWSAEASATFQRSRIGFSRSSSPLAYQPAASGRIGIEYRGRSGGGVRGDVELRGARRSSITGPQELRPFGLVNLRGRQTFHIEGFDAILDAELRNVLNTTYERIELFPEPGRTLELRVTLRRAGRARLQGHAANRSLGSVTAERDASRAAGREATSPGRDRSPQEKS